MDSFYFNLLLGFQHVLDLDGLDHLFFIVVLVINHTFKMWKKTFIWVTFFTLGHTISLFFGNYYKIETSSYIIELLIPITIFLTAISSLSAGILVTMTSWKAVNLFCIPFLILIILSILNADRKKQTSL